MNKPFVLLVWLGLQQELFAKCPASPPGILRSVIMNGVEISKKLKRQVGFEPQL
jgi:hypothetical protein